MAQLVPEAELKKALGNDVFHIETLLAHKGTGKGKKFLVKWKGYGDANNTWEPEKNILDKNMIRIYEANQALGMPAPSTSQPPPVKRPAPPKRGARTTWTTGRRGGRKPSQSAARKRLKTDEANSSADDVVMEDANFIGVRDEKTQVSADGAATSTDHVPASSFDSGMAMAPGSGSNVEEKKKDDLPSDNEEKVRAKELSQEESADDVQELVAKKAHEVCELATGLNAMLERHISVDLSQPRGSQVVDGSSVSSSSSMLDSSTPTEFVAGKATASPAHGGSVTEASAEATVSASVNPSKSVDSLESSFKSVNSRNSSTKPANSSLDLSNGHDDLKNGRFVEEITEVSDGVGNPPHVFRETRMDLSEYQL